MWACAGLFGTTCASNGNSKPVERGFVSASLALNKPLERGFAFTYSDYPLQLLLPLKWNNLFRTINLLEILTNLILATDDPAGEGLAGTGRRPPVPASARLQALPRGLVVYQDRY